MNVEMDGKATMKAHVLDRVCLPVVVVSVRLRHNACGGIMLGGSPSAFPGQAPGTMEPIRGPPLRPSALAD